MSSKQQQHLRQLKQWKQLKQLEQLEQLQLVKLQLQPWLRLDMGKASAGYSAAGG
jgi:hypothetical protein